MLCHLILLVLHFWRLNELFHHSLRILVAFVKRLVHNFLILLFQFFLLSPLRARQLSFYTSGLFQTLLARHILIGGQLFLFLRIRVWRLAWRIKRPSSVMEASLGFTVQRSSFIITIVLTMAMNRRAGRRAFTCQRVSTTTTCFAFLLDCVHDWPFRFARSVSPTRSANRWTRRFQFILIYLAGPNRFYHELIA